MNAVLRQGLNLVLAPLMWVCSSLGFIFEGARSPSDMSDANSSLLVPSGIAFSIWLPIFALCITYGIIQALPKNSDRSVYQIIGRWSAAGFAGVCLWGLINAFAPVTQGFDYAQWGTAIIFVPTVIFLVKAMLLSNVHRDELKGIERIATLGGLSLIAGWCSIAVFLNWAPQTVRLLGDLGLSAEITCILIAALATIWACFISWRSGGNWIYAFPILWGLTFALVSIWGMETRYLALIVALIAAVGILALTTYRASNRLPSSRITKSL